jgi:hypothetical protein
VIVDGAIEIPMSATICSSVVAVRLLPSAVPVIVSVAVVAGWVAGQVTDTFNTPAVIAPMTDVHPSGRPDRTLSG